MKQKAFTMIELLIFVAIIVIVATVALPMLSQFFVSGDASEGMAAGFTGKSSGQLARETTLQKFGNSSNRVEITATNCDSIDTDNNQRVRCTVHYQEFGNTDLSKVFTDVWECPSILSAAQTCVPMRATPMRFN